MPEGNLLCVLCAVLVNCLYICVLCGNSDTDDGHVFQVDKRVKVEAAAANARSKYSSVTPLEHPCESNNAEVFSHGIPQNSRERFLIALRLYIICHPAALRKHGGRHASKHRENVVFPHFPHLSETAAVVLSILSSNFCAHLSNTAQLSPVVGQNDRRQYTWNREKQMAQLVNASPLQGAADEPEKLLSSSKCRSSAVANEPGASDSHGAKVNNSCKLILSTSSPLAEQFPSCRALQPRSGSEDHSPPYRHSSANQPTVFSKQVGGLEGGTVASYSPVHWSSSFDHCSIAPSTISNGKVVDSNVQQPSLCRSDDLGFDYAPVSCSTMYGTTNVGNSYGDCAATKGLIQNNMLQPFTAPYYNSGQCLPNYSVQTAGCALYGNNTAQPYSVASLPQPYAGRNVKSSPYSSFNAYFGTASSALSAAAAPCCATAYASTLGTHGLITLPNVTPPTLECAGYSSGSYPHGYSQYYGGLAYNSYGQISGSIPVVTTTVTYQLSQLPPCTTVATSRSKKRKLNNPTFCLESDFERVFIWDLDETCILFNSLLDGSYATKCGKDVNSSVTIALLMEELILFLSDTHFLFSEMEDCDQVHINDVINDENTQEMV
ncbi:unnamed protein product [Soboliphyme baturini]|uniref:Eyes absent homolog n=1 Tax=Soboliphyme baturini TaxID=241478 RepID=A0A183IKS0_9BILA|nr:unnamed protein product [Soboliphyme baturini]